MSIDSPIRTIKLPSGEAIPVIGQGTWRLGEQAAQRAEEIASLRRGIELGMTLIDAAEMYAEGATEELVGDAIAGHRDEVFLVSKVLPLNATRRRTVEACERSLERLKTDRIDLYLLHWRGVTRLEETIRAFEALIQTGKIRHWSVSNFDLSDMVELTRLPHGNHVQTDQVVYNLARRGIEYDLLPWCRERGLAVMAYSPINQGTLRAHPAVQRVAQRHEATPAQIALAWTLRHEGVVAIPKASTPKHVRENRGALDIHLTPQDLAVLDHAFPPPTAAQPLEMI